MEVNSSSRTPVMAMLFALLLLALPWIGNPSAVADELTEAEMKAVLDLEQQRIKAIEQVQGSVIAVYGKDRSGGGSGVIIHPSGIALTNHHVIIGAGVEGWGGISDGKLYKWKLIGTDPGGDVSMIQLEGRDDFPWTPLGDSDTVRVGDWAFKSTVPSTREILAVPCSTIKARSSASTAAVAFKIEAALTLDLATRFPRTKYGTSSPNC